MILPMLSEIQLSSWERQLIGAALIAGFSLSELAVDALTQSKLERVEELTREIPDAWKAEYGRQIKESVSDGFTN